MAWFTLRACGHGRRSSGLQRQGGAIQEPMLLAQGHQFMISNLHTPHTHTDLHTGPLHVCTHAHTETLPSPSSSTKLLLWSPSLLGPIKSRQDKSITSPTRALSSLVFLPLIIHPCQAKQPSVTGCIGRFSVSAPGSEFSVYTREASSNGPAFVFVATL